MQNVDLTKKAGILQSKKYKIFWKRIKKMEKTIIKFGNIEIGKQKFHQHKRPISINNIDINKIVVSNKVSFDKRGF